MKTTRASRKRSGSPVKDFYKDYKAAGIMFLAVLIADIATKIAVASSWKTSDLGILLINPVRNTGASFGMLQDWNWFFILVSVAAIAALACWMRKMDGKQRLFSALVLAGVVGNLIDRIFRGHVIDFIDFRFWPVFNIADMGICVGVVLLAISIFINKE